MGCWQLTWTGCKGLHEHNVERKGNCRHWVSPWVSWNCNSCGHSTHPQLSQTPLGMSIRSPVFPFLSASSPLGWPHPLPAGPAAGMAAPLLPSRPAVSARGLLGHTAAWLLGASVLCRVWQAAEWPTRGYQDRKSNKEGKKQGSENPSKTKG